MNEILPISIGIFSLCWSLFDMMKESKYCSQVQEVHCCVSIDQMVVLFCQCKQPENFRIFTTSKYEKQPILFLTNFLLAMWHFLAMIFNMMLWNNLLQNTRKCDFHLYKTFKDHELEYTQTTVTVCIFKQLSRHMLGTIFDIQY